MTIPMRLKAHLDQKHVLYEPVFHAPTHGAEYTAAVMHVPGKEMAKTVVLRAGKNALLAVLPASYHVNLEKLAAVVGAPLRLAGKQECNALFPDCEPEAVPPFGELYGLQVYLDETLAEDPEIVLSAGTRCNAVRMGNLDFVRIAKPQVCSFAEKY